MTQLTNKLAHDAPDAKCYVTCGFLPEIIGSDAPQPADVSNRRPYSTILGHVFNQQVDVLLPDEVCEFIQQKFDEVLKPLEYHRIFMGLKNILEKEFYNNYIRKGNIILLSDGRIDVDDVFCLYDGTLLLFLQKETYEKAGLVGKKATFGGRKKERWVVDFDLRAPHMVHGKKAFERIVWSFSKVFKSTQSWLFCDLNHGTESNSSTISGLSVPTVLRKVDMSVKRASHAIKMATFTHKVPQRSRTSEYERTVFYEWAYTFHEWLAMASLGADRLYVSDNIDSLLSRYEPPVESLDEQPEGKLAKISWRGFIPAQYVSKIFDILQRHISKDSWFALTTHGFQNAPISWKGRQHSVVGGAMGGENLYTIFKFPKEAASTGQEDDVVMEDTEGIEDANIADKTECSAKYIIWEAVGGRDEHS